jgi:hypothetical protein
VSAKRAGAKPKKARARAKKTAGGADGLAVVRGVFEALGWEFSTSAVTTASGGSGVMEMLVRTGDDPMLLAIKALHAPGRLVLYAVARFRVPERRLGEAYKFCSLANAVRPFGTIGVRAPAPAEVSFRTSVNYTCVRELDGGLVAGAVADLLDGAERTFAALDQIARGVDADTALEQLVRHAE